MLDRLFQRVIKKEIQNIFTREYQQVFKNILEMHSMHNKAVFEFKHSENGAQFASLSSVGVTVIYHSTITCSGALYTVCVYSVIYVQFSLYNYMCEYKPR